MAGRLNRTEPKSLSCTRLAAVLYVHQWRRNMRLESSVATAAKLFRVECSSCTSWTILSYERTFMTYSEETRLYRTAIITVVWTFSATVWATHEFFFTFFSFFDPKGCPPPVSVPHLWQTVQDVVVFAFRHLGFEWRRLFASCPSCLNGNVKKIKQSRKQ